MGIMLDIAIILFILISTYFGYKKGLISLGIHLVAFVAALFITFVLYRPIGNLIINTTDFDENLQQSIQTNIEKFTENNEGKEETNILVESAKKGMLPQASKELAINIIYGITMIVLYVIARIALMFINALADAVAKLPIIKQANNLGGALYGILRGIFLVYAILLIANLVITLKPESNVKSIMEESVLAKTMSEYNIYNVFFK